MSEWERRYLEDATETALAEESDDLEVVDGEGGFRVCIGVFGVRAGCLARGVEFGGTRATVAHLGHPEGVGGGAQV